MKKYIVLVCVVMVSVALSSCANTVEGAGRDIEGAGQWMQDTFLF